MTVSTNPRVVIVGAGFGGLKAAGILGKSGIEVLLIDRNNYHTFVPLLYQVAVAQLQPQQIAYPLRRILRHLSNTHFLMAEVRKIDFEHQMLETDGSPIPYDFLILATGSQSQFLGVSGASEYTLLMRTLDEAIAVRNHILWCLEQAVKEPELHRRQQLLSFVIVGGGPTGVELAGGLIELIQDTLHQDYPTLDWQQVQVILLQSGECLLVDLPKGLGNYTQKHLRKLGVKVHLQTRVSQVTQNTVHLEDGSTIWAQTIIWTAGMEAAIPTTTRQLSIAAKGKLVVQPTLQLPEESQVYVIGDLAYVEQDGQSLTGVAPEAIQQGAAVAQNIKRQLRGKKPRSFNYFNKGRAAIIARNAGVAQIGKLTFRGFFAWLLWLAIHLFYLPGWRNRLGVLTNWVFDYLFRDRSCPQILPKQLPSWQKNTD